MSTRIADCERCSSPLETGDLLCAVCGALAPVAKAQESGDEDALRVDVLRCRTCGAASRYDASQRGLACAFCGAVTEREELVDPPEQTEAWLPFRLGREGAQRALERWLGRAGFFRPSDLSRRARVASLQPLWWVAWAVDADAQVSWAADSDAGARRADWAPHAGQVRLTFDDVLVSASRGLGAEETRALAAGYDLATARPAPEGPEQDATLEAFDVQRSLARAQVLEAIHARAAERVEADCVPGRRVRNLNVALLLRGLETRRLALPAWVLAYRYGERLFRVVISGQDPGALVGRMPISPWKVLGVVALAVAAIALIVVALAAR